MHQPVFKNKQPFEITVPVPSGNSMRVPPGKYFVGDYFVDYHKQARNSELMPPSFVPQQKDIVCLFTHNQVARESYEAMMGAYPTDVKKYVEEGIVEKNESSKSEELAPKDLEKAERKKGRPKSTLEDTSRTLMSELGKVTPTPAEVENLSEAELNKLAKQFGVPTTFPKDELISVLKERVKG